MAFQEAMARWTTRKASWTAGLLIVLGASLHFLGGMVADPDLWAHLHYGRAILAGEGLPTVDVFSYSAAGAPFYDHEWLFDLVCAAIFENFGATGLVVGKFFLLGVMLLFMVDTARVLRDVLVPGRRFHPLVTAVVLVLGLAVIGPGATFRAQLFTMAFLALEHSLIARIERRRLNEPDRMTPGWELWAFPVLFFVWANIHGGFLVGIALLGIFTISRIAQDGLERSQGRLRVVFPTRSLPLATCGVATLLAPVVNPYGWELYVYLARTLDMHGQISEWNPVELFSDHFLRFKLMFLATAAGVAALWPRNRADAATPSRWPAIAWRGAFYVLAAYAAFRHQRHTVLFSIVATPFLMVAANRGLALLKLRWPAHRPSRTVVAAATLGAVVISLFQIGVWARSFDEHGMRIRYGRLDYPVDAVEFLKRHGFSGNFAMPFEWGAYALTKFGPDAHVFIDGRFEAVYPESVIEDYFAFMNGTEDWERLLDDYPTDVVVVQRWRQIHPRLFERADLEYVYSDPASLVFVRPGPRTQEALTRLARASDRNDFPRLATYFP